jgi:D-glycero-beta-D-manno-heptose 1-phosphate adenylyltransferase
MKRYIVLLSKSDKKLIEPSDLKTWVRDIRSQQKTIATINGSFDLLHAGHLAILFEAKEQADCLLVALNSDRSIEQYKGRLPIVSLAYRLKLMAALEMVDFVTWFEETDPRAFLSIIGPDVHVNGSEYGENCIEAEVVKSSGGRVHIFQRIPGLSTSEIVKRIKDR